MIGTELSRYRITAKLGAGGMGDVYRAVDTRLKREVALKVLPDDLAGDPERLARFQREAEALAALDHPNIVTVFSVEQSEDTHFLTMACVEGQTLGELIPPQGLPTDRLLELGVSLADALRAAHERGIVHRDLKPGNVMVDGEGRLRVLDFGLARIEPTAPLESQLPTRTIREPMTRHGVVLGTVPYMSPEQAEGKRVDARSDLFSFGVVLYEMATGSRPFAGETAAAVVSSILRDTPPSVTAVRSQLPERLGPIIDRCLEKSPDERYPSARELKEELEALRREVASGPVTALSAPKRIRGRLLPVAGALLVAALALVGTRDWWEGAGPGGDDRAPLQAAESSVRSIAVLPMRNLSADPEEEYFVDGVTEALIANLSRISSLRVIARSSAMRFKERDADVRAIAEALGVDAVLEGSVLREGGRVAIRTQLVEPLSESILWSSDETRDVTSVLELQSEIARGIAAGIEVTLTPREASLLSNDRPVKPAAHEAYLKGRFHWYRFTREDLAAAQRYFELALEKDPEYALAYVGLADALGTQAHVGFEPPGRRFEQAKESIERALELNPNLAEAYDLRARIAFAWDWDWEAAERGFRRAIDLNPNMPDVRWVHSQFLAIVGRWDEVLPEARRAVELDPLNPVPAQQLQVRLSWLGRQEEAIAGLEELVASGGDLPLFRRALWETLCVTGQFERAAAEARRYYQLQGQDDYAAELEGVATRAGYERTMARLAEMTQARGWVAPVDLAKLYVQAGRREMALDWLERAWAQRDSRLVYTTVDPLYRKIRSSARYRAILERMGLPLHAAPAARGA